MNYSLTHRQARLVRELAHSPGQPVHWSLLADAIGYEGRYGQVTVNKVVTEVREKFGRDIIIAAPNGTRAGYYLPRDWKLR